VAPVVITSSTTTARSGAADANRTRGGSARRAGRRRPTWRGPLARFRHGCRRRPSSAAISDAIASAGSNPRRMRREGAGGTGTTAVPSRRRATIAAAMDCAARRASGVRAPNFSARTTSRARPSYEAAAMAASRPGTWSAAGWQASRAASQRVQMAADSRQLASQIAHRGGTNRLRTVRREIAEPIGAWWPAVRAPRRAHRQSGEARE
jgi:hypothetical protein